MNRALWHTGWRYMLRHRASSLLMVLGIALGVAVMVAVDLANTSATRAFELSVDAVTVLLAGIRAAKRAETGAVVDALERGAFPGVAGKYRFDSSHQAIWGLASSPLHGTVVRWEKEGARIVFPPPKSPR